MQKYNKKRAMPGWVRLVFTIEDFEMNLFTI